MMTTDTGVASNSVQTIAHSTTTHPPKQGGHKLNLMYTVSKKIPPATRSAP